MHTDALIFVLNQAVRNIITFEDESRRDMYNSTLTAKYFLQLHLRIIYTTLEQ